VQARVDRLAACRCVGAGENLPLAALVEKSVADPKLRRKDPADRSVLPFAGRGFAIQSSLQSSLSRSGAIWCIFRSPSTGLKGWRSSGVGAAWHLACGSR
jgi:hypothetical protein